MRSLLLLNVGNAQDLAFTSSLLNPFVPNAPFLYPLKTSESHKVFWCFQGVEKGCIGKEGVNDGSHLFSEIP